MIRDLRRWIPISTALCAWLLLSPHAGAQTLAAGDVAKLARDVGHEQDIRAVKALQIAYVQYAEAGMWSEMSKLFTAQGEAIYGDDDVNGRSAILNYLRKNFGGGKDGLPTGALHAEFDLTPVVNLSPDGKSAQGRWHEISMLGLSASDARWAGGIMENDYVKENGVWKIARLHYNAQFAGTYEEGWHDVVPDLKIVPYHYTPVSAGVPIPAPADDADLPKLNGSPASNLHALVSRIVALNDEDKVRNLQNIYGYYIDRKMWDDVTELFTKDAVLEIAGQGVYETPAGIRRALEINGPPGLAHGELNDHMQLDVMVDIASDGTQARIRGLEWGLIGQNHGKGYYTVSVFENRFVKIDGIWEIREMRIFPVMKTDYTLGWGKSRIVDGPAPTPYAPDRAAPAADLPGSVPAFFLPNPATGKKIAYPKGTNVSATTELLAWNPAPAGEPPAFGLADAQIKLAQSIGYDAVENISSAFGNYIDDSQWASLGSLFPPNGARKEPAVGSYVGPEHIAHAEAVINGLPRSPRTSIPMHLRTQPVIDISADGRTAKIRTRLFQVASSLNRPGFFSTGGMYEDSAALSDGIWQLTDIEIDHIWRSPGMKQGWIEVPEDFGIRRPSEALTVFPPDKPIKGSTYAPYPSIGRLWFHYRNPVSGRIPADYWPD